jgi:hypothetical protein
MKILIFLPKAGVARLRKYSCGSRRGSARGRLTLRSFLSGTRIDQSFVLDSKLLFLKRWLVLFIFEGGALKHEIFWEVDLIIISRKGLKFIYQIFVLNQIRKSYFFFER